MRLKRGMANYMPPGKGTLLKEIIVDVLIIKFNICTICEEK